MKTPRLVSLCFGILTLATLLHAEPPASTSKEDDFKEKMNALQKAVSDLRGENYPLAKAKPESLEKELARLMKLPADAIHTLVENGLQSADSLVQAQALLGRAEFSKADENYNKVLADKDADPKRLRQAHGGRGLIASIKPDNAAALKHYQSALALYDKDAEPLEWATSATKVVEMLYALAKYKEEEPLVREIVRLREDKLGHSNSAVAEAKANLALMLQDTDQLDKAEMFMRSAWGNEEAALGKAHPKVANHLRDLAQMWKFMGRVKEAEELMRRALAIDEAALGKDHPNVAKDFNNLALLLQETDRLAEGERYIRRALAIDEAAFGKDHPNVAIRLNNLAHLLKVTDRLKEAEPLMRRALVIDEASFGKNSPDIAISLNNLATLLLATDRLKEAEPLMKRALQIMEDSLGKGHPDTRTFRGNLEVIQQKLGK